MATLKVRDRTTNKVRDALVDPEAYGRLKDNKYLTDKNSKEPFREDMSDDGKRQRISLKRDVMEFKSGDPRRVCYVDKTNVFDCRKSNLSTKTKVEKSLKLVKTPRKTRVKKALEVETTATTTTPSATASMPVPTSNLVLPDSLEIKRSLLSQLGEEKVLELIPVDALLAAWATTNGYEKKQA